jgi:hypothetical protein
MSKELDWVDYFDQAYMNAVVHGTGFIKVSVNGPEGFNLSVVDPKDYRYLMEKPPQRTWVGLTDEDYKVLREGVVKQGKPIAWMIEQIEAKLKEKNT